MKNAEILKALEKVDRLAGKSKFLRLFSIPIRYSIAIFFRCIVYPKTKREWILEVPVFFGTKMKIGLPSATDIYLTKGRTHPSELRFARFLITQMPHGIQFLDIGAHYGYFSLLAAKLVGPEGEVRSYEPSPKTYSLLADNVKGITNILAINQAVSDQNGDFTIYEFPNQFSEYNTYNPKPFEKEKWIVKYPPNEIHLTSTTIDHITEDQTFQPQVIKIDAEGSEYFILQGGSKYILSKFPRIAMRFWQAYRQNEMHLKALILLKGWGYQPHRVTTNGSMEYVPDPEIYLIGEDIESDTLVFVNDKEAAIFTI